MDEWTPGNHAGTIYHDPKDELEYWIKRADHDPMVAVPVKLLVAVHKRRQCNETTIVSGDEDGPLTPMVVRCVKQEGHFYRHTNGFTTWKQQIS